MLLGPCLEQIMASLNNLGDVNAIGGRTVWS